MTGGNSIGQESSARSLLIAACILILLQAAALAIAGPSGFAPTISDAIQLALGIICILTSWNAFRNSGAAARYYWRMLILTFVVWATGQSLQLYMDVHPVASLEVADDLIFSLSLAPFGMLLFLDPDNEPNHFDYLHI